MKRILAITIGIPVVVLFALTTVDAQVADVPLSIAYQGHLTDAGGIDYQGNVQMELRLYDSLISGLGQDISNLHVKYAESHASVNVERGNFVIDIGMGVPRSAAWTGLPFDALVQTESLYVELWINGERLSPRMRLGAVPAAVRVQHAKYADTIVNLGTIQADDMPAYGASKITSAQFSETQIPNLDASIISNTSKLRTEHLPLEIPVSRFAATGTLAPSLFSNLDPAMITSGILDTGLFPQGDIIMVGEFAIKVGTLANGQHLFAPTGFEYSECRYMISPIETSGAVEGIDTLVSYLEPGTEAVNNYTCDVYGGCSDATTDVHCTAHYMMLCKKGGWL